MTVVLLMDWASGVGEGKTDKNSSNSECLFRLKLKPFSQAPHGARLQKWLNFNSEFRRILGFYCGWCRGGKLTGLNAGNLGFITLEWDAIAIWIGGKK